MTGTSWPVPRRKLPRLGGGGSIRLFSMFFMSFLLQAFANFPEVANSVMTHILSAAQAGLLLLDPERAHELTLRALEMGLYLSPKIANDPRLAQTLWGLRFVNPVGMAAGFDKDARAAAALLDMGFGFTEAGTVTPLPQAGNPRPRVFRLARERGVINRLGFNNGGHDAALARLQRLAPSRPVSGVIGVNIGANRDSADPAGDYVAGLHKFADVADYFAVNISSPNTPGLRDLQSPERLDALLERLMAARSELVTAGMPWRPILVKLAPDIDDFDLPGIAEKLLQHKVDGAILTNTTIARDSLRGNARSGEAGGLSGRPLFRLSTRMLAKVYRLTQGRLPLIGVGGVDSGEAALAKILAGASLTELYTGLIYEGPVLISRIIRTLQDFVESEGLANICEAVGQEAGAWASDAGR
jgi:dihydroorotate dehydrogenase